VLTVAGLAVFWLLGLHVLLFFRGLFPILTGRTIEVPGLALIDGGILTLLYLVLGVIHRRLWAAWGTLVFFGAQTVARSSVNRLPGAALTGLRRSKMATLCDRAAGDFPFFALYFDEY